MVKRSHPKSGERSLTAVRRPLWVYSVEKLPPAIRRGAACSRRPPKQFSVQSGHAGWTWEFFNRSRAEADARSAMPVST